MSAHAIGKAFLASHITASGGVFAGIAPPGTAAPYCTLQPYGGPGDVMGVAGTRLMSTVHWLVEFWGPATLYDAIESAYEAADASIQQTRNVSVTGGIVLSCVRLLPRLAFLDVGAAQWVRLGGVYELRTQPV